MSPSLVKGVSNSMIGPFNLSPREFEFPSSCAPCIASSRDPVESCNPVVPTADRTTPGPTHLLYAAVFPLIRIARAGTDVLPPPAHVTAALFSQQAAPAGDLVGDREARSQLSCSLNPEKQQIPLKVISWAAQDAPRAVCYPLPPKLRLFTHVFGYLKEDASTWSRSCGEIATATVLSKRQPHRRV